jgi:hypothetical protein
VFYDYHFITHWRVRGIVAEIIDILSDAEDLPRWWPSVYIDVKKRGNIVDKGLAPLHAALEPPRPRDEAGWLHHRSLRRFRRPRRMDADPIRRRRPPHVRLAHPRRKTAIETLLPVNRLP